MSEDLLEQIAKRDATIASLEARQRAAMAAVEVLTEACHRAGDLHAYARYTGADLGEYTPDIDAAKPHRGQCLGCRIDAALPPEGER